MARELRTKLDLITEPKRAIVATAHRRLLCKDGFKYCAISLFKSLFNDN